VGVLELTERMVSNRRVSIELGAGRLERESFHDIIITSLSHKTASVEKKPTAVGRLRPDRIGTRAV
jgi:hypothetical protein